MKNPASNKKTFHNKKIKWIIHPVQSLHPVQSPDAISWTQKITRVLSKKEQGNTDKLMEKLHEKMVECFNESILMLKSPPPIGKIHSISKLEKNSAGEYEINFYFSVIDGNNDWLTQDRNYNFIKRFILWKFCGDDSYKIPGELTPGSFNDYKSLTN